MATNTFDNGGDGSNLYETANDWDLGHIPIATEDVVISVNCAVSSDQSAVACASLTVDNGITLTVANGADIRFTAASTITGTMTMAATSAVYFTDCNLTIAVTTGSVVCDGGILNFVSTTSTIRYLYVDGSLTGTTNANGTTDISATVTTQDKFRVVHNNTAATISGLSSAKRLGLTLNAGASVSYALLIGGHGRGCSYIHLLGTRLGVYLSGTRGGYVTGCDIDGSGLGASSGVFSGTGVTIRDSYIHGCGTGILNSSCEMYGGALGQTPAAASDANTEDVEGSRCLLYDTVWETEVVNLVSTDVISTKHDGDAELFAVWNGLSTLSGFASHITRSETTVVHGGSRQSIKVVTAVGTTSAERVRYDFVITAWPATHGDTLDVTIYVRGQAGDKIWVIVDPESDYGTTQSDEYTHQVNDTWEQVTVPQYTVNTNAAEQMGIPIVIRIEEASKTWYVDTLAVA